MGDSIPLVALRNSEREGVSLDWNSKDMARRLSSESWSHGVVFQF